MNPISREALEHLRQIYPAGTRVELVSMDDAHAPAPGTQGTVIGVDDISSVMVDWDNGSSLNVLWRVDVIRKVKSGENSEQEEHYEKD